VKFFIVYLKKTRTQEHKNKNTRTTQHKNNGGDGEISD